MSTAQGRRGWLRDAKRRLDDKRAVAQFPQTDHRMIPASSRLHAGIVEQRIALPDDRELARRASDAIAQHSRRGWRIGKPRRETNIDAIIALCMALERAKYEPEPVELIGWL
jgi:phage terminase large subunit-like protein